MNTIEINSSTFIFESELTFTASRSSGPGGQHVNKVSTKVTVEFDVFNSPNFSDEQKEILRDRLANRLTKEGILQISSQVSRSQLSNKEDAVNKLVETLCEALVVPKKRRRKRLSLAARYARLQEKKHRSETKQNRKKVDY
jgi:ribosome-associated protein